MRIYGWMALACLVATPVLAEDAAKENTPKGKAPRIERGESTTHSSACSLGQSIAGKLGFKKHLGHDSATKTCSQLAPNMDPPDRAEFLRCCTHKLETGEDAPAVAPKAAPTKPSKSKKKSAQSI